MQSVSNDNFGPLIAYLVPGATVVAALSPYSATLRSWFATGTADAPTVGGFLLLTVAALAAGMTVSAVRWAVVEPLLRLARVPSSPPDYSRLSANLDAVRYLHDIHYRHYLFYANMAVAAVVGYVSYRMLVPGLGWVDVAAVVLESVFVAAARDTLTKLRTRTAQVLAPRKTPSRRRPRRATVRSPSINWND